MDARKPPLTVTAARFARAIRNFANSDVGGKAIGMSAALVALLLGANALNVVNSYVGRNFMTAIASRDTPEFIRQAVLYVGVFAGATVVSVIARFAEERLGLLWRDALTRRSMRLYLSDGAYYRLARSGELTHPDQRIAEDVLAFTVSTLSFVLMAFNSALTILSFSGVLWAISPLLLSVAVAYAALGSLVTFLLGRPLIRLSYDQLDKEASFRSALIHVRENAESIMVARREDALAERLLGRLDSLVANFREIISINRNVGFFSTGYSWLIQIIPALIIAPAFVRGEIEFGVITQSAAAFATLVAAFSLFVTQFQSLSTFAAVVARLSSLVESVEKAQAPAASPIELVEDGPGLAFERLTLLSRDGSPLLKDLSLAIPAGARVLVKAANPAAGAALFRAMAGVQIAGEGRIIRPPAGDILFLAQQPYLPPGSLRRALASPDGRSPPSDERIRALLGEFAVDHVLAHGPNLDAEQNWETFSARERQVLAALRALLAAPAFVVLDRPSAALGLDQMNKVLGMLSAAAIAYVNIGEADAATDLYDAVLEVSENGAWTWTERREEPATGPG